jgi:LacI family transcriptional regulator
MKKKASLKDVAQKVGVSIPLVSYVLSNKGKENRVSEKTAKRIREAAKELNYHPNLNARSLKTNKTKTIGVIVADISNPFFSNLARVIEDEAYLKDYTVIFGSSDENVVKFEKLLNFLQTRQVDGFILAAPEGSKDLIFQLTESDIPCVMIDRYFKGKNLACVVVDNLNASQQATEYLMEKGHQKIASVSYDSSLDHFQDRIDGYLEALQSSSPPLKSFIEKVGHHSLKKDMRRIIGKLIFEDKVDAIYFQTNTLAEEGFKQLLEIDKSILNSVDVVVFDQNSSYSFLENFIPYINQPIKKMGQKSVRMLIDLIEGKKVDKHCVQLKAKLEKEALKTL